MSNELPAEQPLSDEDRVKAQAFQDLEDIRELRNNKPFARYFMRRLAARVAVLEHSILRDRLAPETYREKQIECNTLRGVLTMLDDDEAGNTSITK